MLLLKLYGFLIGGMSLAGFVLMGTDKLLAKLEKRRIPEKTLLTVATLGGAVGSWLAMLLFRHKTRHRAFSIGIPLLTVIQFAIFLAIIFLKAKGGLE